MIIDLQILCSPTSWPMAPQPYAKESFIKTKMHVLRKFSLVAFCNIFECLSRNMAELLVNFYKKAFVFVIFNVIISLT